MFVSVQKRWDRWESILFFSLEMLEVNFLLPSMHSWVWQFQVTCASICSFGCPTRIEALQSLVRFLFFECLYNWSEPFAPRELSSLRLSGLSDIPETWAVASFKPNPRKAWIKREYRGESSSHKIWDIRYQLPRYTLFCHEPGLIDLQKSLQKRQSLNRVEIRNPEETFS